jgi:hypothetical protein
LVAPLTGQAQYGPGGGSEPGGSYRREGDLGFTPKVVCFPPFPPPLDRPISHIAVPALRNVTPAPELSAYVSEIFYPPLSTWLAERTLTDQLRSRLAAFQAEKLALQREIRAELDRQRAADPDDRRSALEELARRQAPRLAALEQTAEQLRADLATSRYDWRAIRSWTLGERNAREIRRLKFPP